MESVVRLGQVSLKCDGLAVTFLRLVELAQLQIRLAQKAVGLRPVRCSRDLFFQDRDGLFRFAHAHQRAPQADAPTRYRRFDFHRLSPSLGGLFVLA